MTESFEGKKTLTVFRHTESSGRLNFLQQECLSVFSRHQPREQQVRETAKLGANLYGN